MVDSIAELKTQMGLVWDIMRHTDVKDPRQEQLRELLASMTQRLVELEPPREQLPDNIKSDY